MCGIAGIVSSSSQALGSIDDMVSCLGHRGPDAQKSFIDTSNGVALGHSRLAILDLTESGEQPMVSSNGRYVIVFNGEIYNFQSLKKIVESKVSISWVSSSDTEVLLELISLFGIKESLELIEGMFAFAVLDREERTIFMCRDRLGEKPLYYGYGDDLFFFGSELKILKPLGGVRREVDRNSLALYLRFGAVPAPYTIYKKIYKLEPGCCLTFSLDSHKLTFGKYWDVTEVYRKGKETPFKGNFPDAKNELDKLLNKAVRSQMQADVGLGAFLSGGVDSSAIVSIMQNNYSGRKVQTFSVGFESKEYSEAEHAKAVADYVGTQHTEITVSESDVLKVVPDIPRIYDEPFADSSQIPTFLVSQLAKGSVSVALSGDGGDELFGGYNRYTMHERFFKRISSCPVSLRTMFATALTTVPPYLWDKCLGPLLKHKYSHIGDKIHKGASVLDSQGVGDFYNRITARIYNPYSWLVLNEREPSKATVSDFDSGLYEPVEQMMIRDLQTYLPNDILTKVDRASMAVSLETRVPFLDRGLVEFAGSLPLDYKLRDNRGKWILREVLYDYVPKELIERPKMGFSMPLGDWLRNPLREWAEDLLSECRLKQEGFFNVQVVRKVWENHLSRRFNNEYQLWNILMFQVWLQQNE
ncbi:asparagine synthase (glutamine-hydrolyzing) [Pseudidiomarina sp. 1APR75-33.1]|uniref:asparagine synthase (glutamine-hydrolyzing) n=1 Tax=Pseudidiomarina terrestris TaxID=2820060 RepID=UPI002656876A|nr:asparagine synthase (glutamine-hydrolyzing) [Pseudidiomarina sp. 1APR75-33.1]MDN7126937.1 asparagine synthase (glutamine-hydrolyzing) [Pseudidiomarina sp. 1APR75-33.1]